ncbi:hypothetical protein [uncultured Fibrobacter sp.]|uniref:hypothetical protein n=1 Tax=uncultured Fibrobacter sp. TaxID=261512 RepID=UPI0028039278|nr:hypothetical protein [uncultured Fibrobacter sp.]
MNKKIKSFFITSTIKDVTSSVGSIVSRTTSMAKDLFGFVDGLASKGDKIAKTAKVLGITAQEFQALSFAADRSGVSVGELESGMKFFSKTLGEAANNGGNSLEKFNKLKVKLWTDDSKTKMRSTIDILNDISKVYANLTNGADKAFLSTQLFGRAGMGLSVMMADGSTTLSDLLKEYNELGGGFSDEGAKQAEAFKDALANLNVVFNSLKSSIGESLFPKLTEIFKSLTVGINDKNSDLSKSFQTLTESLGKLFDSVAKNLPTIIKWFAAIVDYSARFFGFCGPVLTLLLVNLPSIVIILHSLIAPFNFLWSIFKKIKTIAPIILKGIVVPFKALFALVGGTGLATIGLFIAAFVLWGKVFHDIYKNWDMLVSFVTHEVKDGVLGFLSDVWDGIKSIGAALYEFFVAPFVNAFDMLPMIWDAFKEGIGKVADMFMELGGQIFDAIFGAVRRAWDAAKGFLSNLPLVGGLFENEAPANPATASATAAESIGEMVRSTNTTTTSRFAVDFQNMPRGVTVTPPGSGDFDFSRGYVFGGGV